MKNFSHIYYTDAYYILEEPDRLITKLPKNEAFGYITKAKNNNIILHFIKRADGIDSKKIIKGLVLPVNSINSENKKYINELNSLKIKQHVSITWNDVVFVENEVREECSIMYTEGILFKNELDHIVIKDPETVRTHPLPIRNHPKVKPLYYVIPKVLINSFEIVNNKKHE